MALADAPNLFHGLRISSADELNGAGKIRFIETADDIDRIGTLERDVKKQEGRFYFFHRLECFIGTAKALDAKTQWGGGLSDDVLNGGLIAWSLIFFNNLRWKGISRFVYQTVNICSNWPVEADFETSPSNRSITDFTYKLAGRKGKNGPIR